MGGISVGTGGTTFYDFSQVYVEDRRRELS